MQTRPLILDVAEILQQAFEIASICNSSTPGLQEALFPKLGITSPSFGLVPVLEASVPHQSPNECVIDLDGCRNSETEYKAGAGHLSKRKHFEA